MSSDRRAAPPARSHVPDGVLRHYLRKLVERLDLSEQECSDSLSRIVDGQCSPTVTAGFLVALSMKGETPREIASLVRAVRERQISISPRVDFCIDTNGTGGDGANTFNISTASAFVIAGSGVPVAKYGGRAFSSNCGSADVMEALGCVIQQRPSRVQECIEHVGIGFLYSPCFSDGLKACEGIRRDLGVRTVFNVVAPLTNPASPQGNVMGVYSPDLARPVAETLRLLNVQRALVVHGDDGLDEITLAGSTQITELRQGQISTYRIRPEDFGLKPQSLDAIKGADRHTNARMILDVLNAKHGAARDIVVLNSAAGLYVGGKVPTIAEGIAAAQHGIDSGAALNKLSALIEFYGH
jgi:anthranilate phosphoribosyltransferase